MIAVGRARSQGTGVSLDTGVSLAFVVGAIAVGVGFLVASGDAVVMTGVLVTAAAFAIGLSDWRRSLHGLLLFLPFSGLLIIATYPNTALAVLVKDVAFVLPAYLGFVAFYSVSRAVTAPPRSVTVAVLILAVLVLGQALNSDVPNLLVAAIGVKVWLLYVPLYVLGFHLVRDVRELRRVLRMMSMVAIAPATVGIVEALLIYSGHSATVYGWYGKAAPAVTQEFAALSYDAGAASLHRIPSFFSGTTQYYSYLAAMVAVSFAWWRSSEHASRERKPARAVWLLMLAAGFLSGARAVFLFLPFMIVLMLVLERPGFSISISSLVAPITGLVLAVGAIGVTAGGLVAGTVLTARREFVDVFWNGMGQALSASFFGRGTGTDTAGARYAFPSQQAYQAAIGHWQESWFVKAAVELGFVGLVAVTVLFAVLFVRSVRIHRALADPAMRTVSAALIAFLGWGIASSVKGQYLDFDPANVYFWFFMGLLARIPHLARTSSQADVGRFSG